MSSLSKPTLSVRLRKWMSLSCVAAFFTLASGCSYSPSAVSPPSISGAEAGRQAIDDYDADGDQLLSADELRGCPGILSDFQSFDTDGDQKVSADEIAKVVKVWEDDKAGLLAIMVNVTYKGRPLPQAIVTFTPADFLQDAVSPATGVTDSRGGCTPSLSAEALPGDNPNLAAMQPGIYRVSITHPEIDLPAKYNTETELGANVNLATGSNGLTFKLR